MSGLSREDRARLEVLGQYVDCEVALRALALIDQQEAAATDISEERDQLQARVNDLAKALEAAEELADLVDRGKEAAGRHDELRIPMCDAERAYRSARATSTKEDG